MAAPAAAAAGGGGAVGGFKGFFDRIRQSKQGGGGGGVEVNPAATAGTGANAANDAFQNYLNSTGYQFRLGQGMDAITGNAATKGLLNSGATLKGLNTYGQNMASQEFGNYLNQVGQLAQGGLGAASVLAQAGQTGSSKEKPNIIGTLFSDRRLKEAIRKVGEFADGLGLYEFRYAFSKLVHRGVMADEVAALRPWALGPVKDGFLTVDYAAL
jgi:hypothetical protein